MSGGCSLAKLTQQKATTLLSASRTTARKDTSSASQTVALTALFHDSRDSVDCQDSQVIKQEFKFQLTNMEEVVTFLLITILQPLMKLQIRAMITER